MNAKIGFIGMGNMGYALLKGMLGVFPASDFMFSCKTNEKKKAISKETGVAAASSNAELADSVKYIILAIKPQMYDEVFAEIKGHVTAENVVVSLAPGKSIAWISEKLGGGIRVVRAMPNTPALIGYGMSGVAYDEESFSEDEKNIIDKLFSSVGSYKKVPEDQMSAVVCASGSSPAYVYMFIDALAKSAAGKGLPYEDALELVTKTVIGAARMVETTGESPDSLKQRVCSKGGTTIAGVSQLDARGFTGAIDAATDACYMKSEELGS